MKSIVSGLVLASSVLLTGVHHTAVASSIQSHRAGAARSSATSCATAPLGLAGSYNGFFLNDVNGSGSGVGGRLAVGGNATLADYSVGASLTDARSQPDLVVGNNLTFTRGSISGPVFYGGNATVTNTWMGAGDAVQGHPIDFTAAGALLEGAAVAYGNLKANARVSGPHNSLNLRGTNRIRNVFHVNGKRLSTAHALTISVPSGSTALIVVRGQTSALQSLGVSLHGGNTSKVLFDFPTARSLTIRSIGLKASILAPLAAISFSDGAINGTLIGASLHGTGHLDSAAFAGCLPRL